MKPSFSQTNLSTPWALSAELVPGALSLLTLRHFNNPGQTISPVLGGSLWVSFYAIDQCQTLNTRTCITLPVFARIGTLHSLDLPPSQVSFSLGLEPTFFFGTQRVVGLTFSGAIGYRYTFLREPSSLTIRDHTIFIQAGAGLVFSLQSPAKGLQGYFRFEYDAQIAITVPIGIRYRF